MARPARGAAPSPAAVLRRVRQDLESGWPAGLTVLTGDDLFHLDRAQALLLARLAPGDDPLTLTVVAGERGEKVAIPDVVAAARSMPMFTERRVVLVRDVLVLEGEADALAGYAKAPPARSFLLVRAPKLDLRRSLHQTLATAGTLLEFRADAARGPADVAPIETMAKEHGLALERGVAQFLYEACAGDLARVEREVEKLDAWAGAAAKGARPIRLADAREVGAAGGLMDGWEAANAVLARDRGAAVAAVRRLLDHGTVPYMLLGGLAGRARAMLQAKAMLEAGESPQAVASAVRAFYYERDLDRKLRNFTMAELLAFPARLHEADLALKSRGLDHRAVLETLVADLTQPGAR